MALRVSTKRVLARTGVDRRRWARFDGKSNAPVVGHGSRVAGRGSWVVGRESRAATRPRLLSKL